MQEASADAVGAVKGGALPRVFAGAAVVKHDQVASNLVAVGLGALVVDLGHLRGEGLILVAWRACLLRVFVNPGVLSRKQVEFAGDGAGEQFGKAPELVPVAVVERYLLVGLLLVVLVAQVGLDGLQGFGADHLGAVDLSAESSSDEQC